MPLWKLHRLRPESQSYTALIGLIATAASALLTIAGAEIGLVGAKVIVESAIAFCLLWRFVEPPAAPFTPKLTAMLILSGIAMGAMWITFLAPDRPAGGFMDLQAHPFILLAIGYINATVTAPLFEEKIVRGLLFDGLSKHMNSLLASISVSALFGIAHMGNMVWAFAGSLALCWMMLKFTLNTYQRAIVHGTVNFVIMTWYFVS